MDGMQEMIILDAHDFDHLARAVTTNLSRRAIVRRVAGSAIAAPFAVGGFRSARADGKDKAKPPKDKPP